MEKKKGRGGKLREGGGREKTTTEEEAEKKEGGPLPCRKGVFDLYLETLRKPGIIGLAAPEARERTSTPKMS